MSDIHKANLRNTESKILYEKSMLLTKLAALEMQLRSPLQDDWDDALNIASSHIYTAYQSISCALAALQDH